MPRTRTTYTAEFKLRAVQMITDQRLSVAEAARQLGIGENLTHPWQPPAGGLEQPAPAVPILGVGRGRQQRPDQPEQVDRHEPLPPADLFPPVVPLRAATVGDLDRRAVDPQGRWGRGGRPRPGPPPVTGRGWPPRCPTPATPGSARTPSATAGSHAAAVARPTRPGGGRRMAFTTSRASVAGRPPLRVPDFGPGRSGTSRSHWSSVRSVGYAFRVMPSLYPGPIPGFKTHIHSQL